MYILFFLLCFAPFLTQAQMNQLVNIHNYDSLGKHTSTIKHINSAVQMDSFEYDKVGAITRHLRYTEAPDLQITGVEYNGTSYSPNPLPLLRNVVGNLEITHENIGNRDAGAFGIEVHWSPDTLWKNGNDTFLYDISISSLAAGVNKTEPNSNFYLGNNIPTGSGYLLFYTDDEYTILELNDSNNLHWIPIYVCTPYTLTTSGVDDYCGTAQGTAIVSATGGTAPYSYTWNQGTSSSTVNGLQGSLGGTSYTVTATDANGCTASDQVSISSNSALTLQAVSTTPAHCGNTTGQITVDAQGGGGNISYHWSTGQTTNIGTIGGLIQGTYGVTATDANNCTTSMSNIVSGSAAITLGTTIVDDTCSQNNGAISITPTGGLGGYNILWGTGNTGISLSNLAAGIYAVTVDDGTCSATDSILVNDLAAPTLITTSYSTDCGQSNGSIGTAIIGGATPLTFLWNTGNTTDSLGAIQAGSYTLTITDANGCTTSKTTTVNTQNSLSVNTSVFDDSCNLAVGSINAQVSGGSGNYNYTWTGSNNTTNTLSGLVQGIYTVTITDSNAPQVCTLTHTDTITSTSAIILALQSISADTCGYGNAAALLSAVGDTTSMTFSWSNGANTLFIDSLSAGSYSLTATNANNCVTTYNLTIPTISFVPNVASYPVSVDSVSCLLQVAETGNALFLPYKYSWSNGATSNPILGIPLQTYQVTVTNTAGCDTILSFDCTPISIESIEYDFDISIFPNPNSGEQFSVEIIGGEIQAYEVYDAIGQQLVNSKINIPTNTPTLLPKTINVAGSYVFVFEVWANGQLYRIDKKVIKSRN